MGLADSMCGAQRARRGQARTVHRGWRVKGTKGAQLGLAEGAGGGPGECRVGGSQRVQGGLRGASRWCGGHMARLAVSAGRAWALWGALRVAG